MHAYRWGRQGDDDAKRVMKRERGFFGSDGRFIRCVGVRVRIMVRVAARPRARVRVRLRVRVRVGVSVCLVLASLSFECVDQG